MNVLICHCFGYTDDDIREDLARNGRSTILERILAAKREGACRCFETSPDGT